MSYLPTSTETMLDKCLKVKEDLQKEDEDVVNWYASAVQQAAQGSGGVAIPGGVQKKCRCGTSGHGLAGTVVSG